MHYALLDDTFRGAFGRLVCFYGYVVSVLISMYSDIFQYYENSSLNLMEVLSLGCPNAPLEKRTHSLALSQTYQTPRSHH